MLFPHGEPVRDKKTLTAEATQRLESFKEARATLENATTEEAREKAREQILDQARHFQMMYQDLLQAVDLDIAQYLDWSKQKSTSPIAKVIACIYSKLSLQLES